MFLTPLAENALHEGPGPNVLDVAENRDMVGFPRLPALLDTIVDKRDETGCNDDATCDVSDWRSQRGGMVHELTQQHL